MTDGKRCAQTALVVFVRGSWAGLHFERFRVQFFCDVHDFIDSPCPDTRHASQTRPSLWKNRVSALTKKCGSWTRARKTSHPRWLRKRSDVPHLLFTHVIAINWEYVFLRFYQHDDDQLILLNLSFYQHYVIAINWYYVTLGILQKIRLGWSSIIGHFWKSEQW